MENDCLGILPLPEGHEYRLHDQIFAHMALHGPSNDLPGKEINHRSKVEPPFTGPNIGDISDPLVIGCLCIKVTFQVVLDTIWTIA